MGVLARLQLMVAVVGDYFQAGILEVQLLAVAEALLVLVRLVQLLEVTEAQGQRPVALAA